MDATKPERAALAIPQFCAAYGLSRTACYQEIRAGRLRAVRIGKRRTAILRADAETWADSLQPLTAA
ncbi:phage excisionase [mine drainage metagenome]|uniref:Phage excisionase n=1 Tax=mine drainage metagenome TaxID=410659 RepID=T1AYB4_9ZZZZ